MKNQSPWGQIFESSYELSPRAAIGSVAGQRSRQGALLRFEFSGESVHSGFQVGYADCFPWPELGDAPLPAQLESLKTGTLASLTPLTARSYELARVDADARSRGVSLWEDLRIPSSHALVTDLKSFSCGTLRRFSAEGFTHIKFKLRCEQEDVRTLLEYCDQFKSLNLKIRLDFNGAFCSDQVHLLLKELLPLMDRLDFIEDPCPYEPTVWASLQRQWNIRLAMDHLPDDLDFSNIQPHLGAFSVLVVKPAIQNPDRMIHIANRLGVSVAVTSYLDHPLGQLGAAWVAARMATQKSPQMGPRMEVCGLLSHFAYGETLYASEIKSMGPFLLAPKGTGFGMDQQLSRENWREI